MKLISLVTVLLDSTELIREVQVCPYVRRPLKVSILWEITLPSDDGFQKPWFTVQHKKLKSVVVFVACISTDVPLANLLSSCYAWKGHHYIGLF